MDEYSYTEIIRKRPDVTGENNARRSTAKHSLSIVCLLAYLPHMTRGTLPIDSISKSSGDTASFFDTLCRTHTL